MVEVFRSVPVPWQNGRSMPGFGWWRRLVAFLGPGYLVAVGYMDPGNWATALNGGARFGYSLLVVALLSNIMAIVLQALAIRLGVGSGRDLASATRDGLPSFLRLPMWAMAEMAIIATDLAEVIGTAVALNLLFGLPILWGVLLTVFDVLLILWLQSKGFRKVEALVVAFLLVISVCFGLQLAMARPEWSALLHGFIPTTELITNPDMLYISLAIMGATVMPHNLYLHSAIVQTRAFNKTNSGKRQAMHYATLDSFLALSLAFVINASIIILAAAVFYSGNQKNIVGLEQAHELLQPMLGSWLAPNLFAVALLACGLSSTITATMAGQVVMEGFMQWRVKAWVRRLFTRGLAVIPAAVVAGFFGSAETSKLLILSQVLLSVQLPFAIIPLVMFTASKKKLGALVAPRWLTAVAIVIAAVVILLNIKQIIDSVWH